MAFKIGRYIGYHDNRIERNAIPLIAKMQKMACNSELVRNAEKVNIKH